MPWETSRHISPFMVSTEGLLKLAKKPRLCWRIFLPCLPKSGGKTLLWSLRMRYWMRIAAIVRATHLCLCGSHIFPTIKMSKCLPRWDDKARLGLLSLIVVEKNWLLSDTPSRNLYEQERCYLHWNQQKVVLTLPLLHTTCTCLQLIKVSVYSFILFLLIFLYPWAGQTIPAIHPCCFQYLVPWNKTQHLISLSSPVSPPLLGLLFDALCHEFHCQWSARTLGSLCNPFPSQRRPRKTDAEAVKSKRLKRLTLNHRSRHRQ